MTQPTNAYARALNCSPCVPPAVPCTGTHCRKSSERAWATCTRPSMASLSSAFASATSTRTGISRRTPTTSVTVQHAQDALAHNGSQRSSATIILLSATYPALLSQHSSLLTADCIVHLYNSVVTVPLLGAPGRARRLCISLLQSADSGAHPAARLAVGEAVILLHPSPFSRRFNSGGEGMPAKWQNGKMTQ